ncbi:hypothetical protein J6590_034690 [Homalodisca vitripennis]|nr:hypothetical protein J6590_034690 [Homalodisca vitripennis]
MDGEEGSLQNLAAKLQYEILREHHQLSENRRLEGDNGEHNVTALLQLQSLTGDNFLEKERRLSEMILQLQMVREQLLSQQEQQNKVGLFFDDPYKNFSSVLSPPLHFNRLTVNPKTSKNLSASASDQMKLTN